MPTVEVKVLSNNGTFTKARILIDLASDESHVMESFVKKISTTCKSYNVEVQALDEKAVQQPSFSTTLNLTSKNGAFKANVSALIMPQIAKSIPALDSKLILDFQLQNVAL